MGNLKDLKLDEFVALTATDAPAPGGGSVAAAVASLGAALGEMVYNLTKDKKLYLELDEQSKAAVMRDFTALSQLRTELIALIDEDTKAFDTFMSALHLPKTTEEEKAVRREAMARAAIVSMQAPLETAGKSLAIIEHMDSIARHGSKNCISDAGVGALCAKAAVESAVMNVRINLGGVKDEAVRQQAELKCQDYLVRADKLCAQIVEIVYEKI